MDIITKVAALVKQAFPELGDRVMAVSEVEMNKERVPRLPACMVALRYEAPHGKGAINTASQNELCEYFLVDFWLEPVVYDQDGKEIDREAAAGAAAETVYYAFYPYDTIRNRLLNAIAQLETDQKGRIYYEKLELSADKFAVSLTFSFSHRWFWCPDDPSPAELVDATARKIIFRGFCGKVEDNGNR